MSISANQIRFVVSLAIFMVGAIYLGIKFKSLHGTFAVDFDYIWLSGKVWLSGQSPYSSAFGEMARTGDLFKGTKPPEMFGYPFNWALPAMALATMGLESATFCWRLASILAMILSVLLIFLASRSNTLTLQFRDVLITLGYLFLMQATATSLANGQTGWVVLLGLSLIFFGVSSKGTFITAMGLVLVMLKPQIGIPILATLAVRPRLWPAIAIGGVLSVALAIPAFVISGVLETIVGFMQNVSSYTLNAVNAPPSMTGIWNPVWTLFNLELNPIVLVIISSLTAVATTVMHSRIVGQHSQSVTGALFITLAIIIAIVPLHTYDFVVVSPMVLVFLGHQHAARWLVLLALLMMIRSDNVGNWSGFHGDGAVYYHGGMLNSLASIPLLIGSIWLFFAGHRPVSGPHGKADSAGASA